MRKLRTAEHERKTVSGNVFLVERISFHLWLQFKKFRKYKQKVILREGILVRKTYILFNLVTLGDTTYLIKCRSNN